MLSSSWRNSEKAFVSNQSSESNILKYFPVANSIALLQAAIMMLDHLNKHDERKKILKAVLKTLQDGKDLTKDLGGTATTKELMNAIISNL